LLKKAAFTHKIVTECNKPVKKCEKAQAVPIDLPIITEIGWHRGCLAKKL
jgi:hypothetical protein